MGFFDRIGSIFKGKASNAMSRMESSNPEAVYEAAISSRQQQLIDMKKAAAEIAMLRKRAEEELEDKRRKLSQSDNLIQAAVEGGEDEAALVLLEEKETLAARITTLESELEGFSGKVEEITAAMRTFQGEIEKLKREKAEMLSRKANAEAQLQINDTLSGLSQEADVRGLANVREHIDRLASDAELEVQGAKRVTTERLNKSRAASQLAALKAQMSSKGGTAAPSAPAAADAPPTEADAAAEPEEDPTPRRTL